MDEMYIAGCSKPYIGIGEFSILIKHGSMHYIIIGRQLPGSYQFKLRSAVADETLWLSLSMDENISFV